MERNNRKVYTGTVISTKMAYEFIKEIPCT